MILKIFKDKQHSTEQNIRVIGPRKTGFFFKEPVFFVQLKKE